MDSDAVIVQNIEFRLRTFSGHFLLMKEEKALEINTVGVAIWKEVATPLSVDNVIQRIAELYSQEQTAIEVDIKDFLKKLLRLGAIEVE